MSKQKIWDIHLKVDGLPDAEMLKSMQQLAERIMEDLSRTTKAPLA
ncbi:hypothetical protein SH528x_004221 [Novipirellula sp. SH528]